MSNYFGGIEFVIDDNLPKRKDFSACRSPSRARRRDAYGIPNKHIILADQAFLIGSPRMRGRMVVSGEAFTALKTMFGTFVA